MFLLENGLLTHEIDDSTIILLCTNEGFQDFWVDIAHMSLDLSYILSQISHKYTIYQPQNLSLLYAENESQ